MEQKPTNRMVEIPENVLASVLALLKQLPWDQANPYIVAIDRTARVKEELVAKVAPKLEAPKVEEAKVE